MVSAFSDSLMGSGGRGVETPPWDFKTYRKYEYEIFTRCWYPYGGTKSKKQIDISDLVCRLQTKIPKIPIFGNATSRHANLTKFCRNINIDVRNKPWKFQIDISKIGYFTEHSVKCRKSWSVKYRTARKIQNRSHDFTKFTRWCHVIHI